MKKGLASLVLPFMAMGAMADNLQEPTPSITDKRGYSQRLTPLTKKQKARRKLNKIGRKSRKLNFKKN